MDSRQRELSKYRIKEAQDSLKYKDSINRSYYAAFMR